MTTFSPVVINKVKLSIPKIEDMLGWMMPNLFISTQMLVSTDPSGNFCMESYRFLPES